MARRNCSTSCKTVIFTETGRKCGYVQDGVFYRRIDDNQFLNKPPALAQGVYALEQIRAAGAERMEFRHKRTGEVYRATLEHFMRASFEFDRGYGRQRALPIFGWTLERPGGRPRPAPDTKSKRKLEQARQLGLFGGGR